MSLTKLAATAKERGRTDAGSVVVSVAHHATGDTEELRFRRPTKSDLFPPQALRDRVAQLTGGRADLATEILLMAACFMPDPAEGRVDSVGLFAAIALSDDLLFSDISQAFVEAFPEFTGWLESRAARMAELRGDTPGNAEGESPTQSVAESGA